MYTSDWHIHSSASYDAQLLVPDLINAAAEIGVTRFGITDHANFPIPSFLVIWKSLKGFMTSMVLRGSI